jgi:hypothetical protein
VRPWHLLRGPSPKKTLGHTAQYKRTALSAFSSTYYNKSVTCVPGNSLIRCAFDFKMFVTYLTQFCLSDDYLTLRVIFQELFVTFAQKNMGNLEQF